MSRAASWQRYRRYLCRHDELGLRLDISRMRFDDGFVERMAEPMAAALAAMAELEAGAIANPDEGRQVGHYWLRAAELAPSDEQRLAIVAARQQVERFARAVHDGDIAPERGDRFTDVLIIGIGGSALGPQLIADALGHPDADRMRLHFFDNTDPDGMAKILATIGDRIERTLAVVISKSGGTAETRNGMLVAGRAYDQAGLGFARHACAVTGDGSKLDQLAARGDWLARFPMWDWVGGRTSVTSAVGLLPAALQGLDIDALLAGARDCDAVTRDHDLRRNPAALLALMWHYGSGGCGERDMVVLPYKDRLLLFSRYLQQLIMESLGKSLDLDGNEVAQGLSVYGNKGSTDQHAYVQQLRDGVDNFFVTFVEVHEEGGAGVEVEAGVTSGDYLRGFLLGTREALSAAGRESMTVSLDRLDGHRLGVLIALYERAVGLYASLIHVNAYHQPGVEAGKRAAGDVLAAQRQALAALAAADRPLSIAELSIAMAEEAEPETLFHIAEGLLANGRLTIAGSSTEQEGLFSRRYLLAPTETLA